MKRSAFNHPKVSRLAKALGIELWAARGIMESLWHVTAMHARRGDIGAHLTDQEIADRIGWKGSARRLIANLVATRLLDRGGYSRLCVHDWADHADSSVRKTLAKYGETFISVPEQNGNEEGTVLPRRSPSPSHSQKPEPKPKPEPIPGPRPGAPDDADEQDTDGSDSDSFLRDTSSGSVFGTAPDTTEKRLDGLPEERSGPKTGNHTSKGEIVDPGASWSEIASSANNGAKLIADTLAIHVGISTAGAPPGSARACQLQADLTCLALMAKHIVNGDTGPPQDAKESAYAKAKEIGKSRTIRNRMSVMQAWFQGRLKEHGKAW